MSNEYYDLLGMNKDSTNDDIKKAYHKMALKWHPDKNKDPNAVDMFRKITEAYNTLTDPDKRIKYDKCLKPNVEPLNTKQGKQNNIDIEMTVHAHLKDVFIGKNLKQTIMRNSMCTSCNGTGSIDNLVHVCRMCNGHRVVQQQNRVGNLIYVKTVTCTKCSGSGIDTETYACKFCYGSKVIWEKYVIDIFIPIGCYDGKRIIMSNIGNYNMTTKTRGCIIINVVIDKHPIFARNSIINGNIKLGVRDLLTVVDVTLAEAICGYTKTIKHVNNKDLVFRASGIIKNGDVFVMRGEGIPVDTNLVSSNNAGNLYVMFNVKYPQVLSEEKSKLIWEILTDTPYEKNSNELNTILEKMTGNVFC
jgi:DnaJ-class molecular chaperone